MSFLKQKTENMANTIENTDTSAPAETTRFNVPLSIEKRYEQIAGEGSRLADKLALLRAETRFDWDENDYALCDLKHIDPKLRESCDYKVPFAQFAKGEETGIMLDMRNIVSTAEMKLALKLLYQTSSIAKPSEVVTIADRDLAVACLLRVRSGEKPKVDAKDDATSPDAEVVALVDDAGKRFTAAEIVLAAIECHGAGTSLEAWSVKTLEKIEKAAKAKIADRKA